MESLDGYLEELHHRCSGRFFWAPQPREHAFVTTMNEVMSQIRDGTLKAGVDNGWDVSI